MIRNRNVRFKRRGQALVEMALLVTLLFFLISAAFDLGMIFFAYQGIANAALEGVSYGSMFPRGDPNNPSSTISEWDDEIQLRVRNEPFIPSSTTSQVRLVNLQDLDANGTADSEAVVDTYIDIEIKPNDHAQPFIDEGLTPCSDTNRTIELCDIYVTVRYDYKPFFFLAPFMGAGTFPIEVTRSMTIRDVSSP
ncbi:MAG: pilus assembly protein TadE [Herpetosiphonaceae bacterium]|nr:MAG: pilus assembly protein TadE [Herpetosiphonaceae bacterium]